MSLLRVTRAEVIVTGPLLHSDNSGYTTMRVVTSKYRTFTPSADIFNDV